MSVSNPPPMYMGAPSVSFDREPLSTRPRRAANPVSVGLYAAGATERAGTLSLTAVRMVDS